jgi:hypothetical protein
MKINRFAFISKTPEAPREQGKPAKGKGSGDGIAHGPVRSTRPQSEKSPTHSEERPTPFRSPEGSSFEPARRNKHIAPSGENGLGDEQIQGKPGKTGSGEGKATGKRPVIE